MRTNFYRVAAPLLFIMLCVSSAAKARQSTSEKQRIIIASGVRLRAEANSASAEVARLGLGVIVKEISQSTVKEQIGGVEGYWCQVALPDGKQGWVFGSLAAPFDPGKRADAYQKITSARLKVESVTFAEWIDLEKFLSKAVTEITQLDALAELEFGRLLALKRALESIPSDKQQEPTYQNWIKPREKIVAYSEPAGLWLPQADLFWDLQKKYSALAIAERIAWEAANTLLPGECEGYIPCHLYAFNQTAGRYLKLYPQGPHANEAVDNLAEMLASFVESISSAPRPDAVDRTEARKELPTLRAALMKTTAQKKALALKQIEMLEKHYR
jgi:hypothetical protein